MKASNFDIRIDKGTVLYLLANDCLKPGTEIMCKEYGDDDDWSGVYKDDIETLEDDEYQTFELWGNGAPVYTDRCEHLDFDGMMDRTICNDCAFELIVKEEA